jgi:hypothetical protein
MDGKYLIKIRLEKIGKAFVNIDSRINLVHIIINKT